MGKTLALLAAVAVGAAVVSCGPTEQTAMVQHRDAELKGFQPISYSRRVDDVEEKITIAADGSLTRTRIGPPQSGKLSEFQVMQLKRLCDDFGKLSSKYPASPDSESTGLTTIKYGQKSVTVSDGAKEVPQPFVLIREKIEQCSRDTARVAASDGGTP
jgi:hypothetical protein